MNFFQRRRLRKQVRHILHDARHARHMREDLVDAALIEGVYDAEQALREAWAQRDYAGVEQAGEMLIRRTEALYPPKSHPRLREYLEILVVAVTVAMAFRTFFVQPFKIPTGSMEPTLNGIKVEAQVGKGVMDHFPLNLVRLVFFGDRYVEVQAARSGVVGRLIREDPYIYSVDGVVPPFRVGMAQHFDLGDFVTKGQVLASGRVRSGDHIFVNKVRYNFTRPKRGDVFVFSTDGVDHPQVQADTFYIKRLVGLPGEAISIDPPYLMANGQRISEPEAFRRQVQDRARGYHGYVFPPRDQVTHPPSPPPILAHRNSVLHLAADEYLPLGDNTTQSLDGRYFGGIRRDNVVGPAVVVYWPISERWGRIR
jgi:signal peptidase I